MTTRRSREVLEANARLWAARERVWDTLRDPATSKVIWPEVVHAEVLPGTGPGVGEIQVEVRRAADGTLAIRGLIVEAWRPPEFVRYVSLDDSALRRSSSEITMSELEPSLTRVRWVTSLDWEPGVPVGVVEQTVEIYRAFMTTHLRGSGRILNAPIDLPGCWRMT